MDDREPTSPLAPESDSESTTSPDSRGLLLLVVRLLFLVLLVAVSMLIFAGEAAGVEFQPQTFLGVFLASTAVGIIVILIDALTPNKRLSSVVGVYLGICFGLISAVAIGALIDVISNALGIADAQGPTPILLAVSKATIALIICYFSVSVVLTTKDDFRLVIPYVEFARQVRGVRPLLVDTSALIDGRIDEVGRSGFIDAPILITSFVLEELQRLADSEDRQKRFRGKRGLDMVGKLQHNPYLDVSIDGSRPEGVGVDAKLVKLARDADFRLLSSDQNLLRVAEIHDVTVLNLNDLASALKTSAIPGDTLVVEIIKAGENPDQGVGYLPDGTMVVVDACAQRLGETLEVSVTNALQTSAGKMIFASIPATDATNTPRALRDAAVSQPKAKGPGPRGSGDDQRRSDRSGSRKRHPRRGE